MRKKFMIVMIIVCLGFVGCSATELEERCFPQLVAVGYEDNRVVYSAGFPRVGSSGEKEPKINEIQVAPTSAKTFKESRQEYEMHLNKTADYNHLKVLILEEDFLEETKAYEKMLDALAESEDFPRNTYVCAVEDIEDLLEIDKNLPQDLGTYLEEYLNNHEEKKDKILSLGDLIDEKANGEMILYMPYLDVEENYVTWGGYYAIGKGREPIEID